MWANLPGTVKTSTSCRANFTTAVVSSQICHTGTSMILLMCWPVGSTVFCTFCIAEVCLCHHKHVHGLLDCLLHSFLPRMDSLLLGCCTVAACVMPEFMQSNFSLSKYSLVILDSLLVPSESAFTWVVGVRTTQCAAEPAPVESRRARVPPDENTDSEEPPPFSVTS